MAKVFVISKKQAVLATGFAVAALAASLYFGADKLLPTSAEPVAERTIHLVTAEFSSKTGDGTTIEAYRWDPGTIVVKKGERIHLSLYGVNGESHPFIIEGLNVKGEVKKFLSPLIMQARIASSA